MAKRVKKIFKKWIKEALLARGETLLGVERNKINTNCIVYVFEYSDTFDNNIAHILENKETYRLR